MNNKRLTRSQDRILMGVCGGLAQYWNTEAWIVRLVCALLILAYPQLFLVYLLFGIILPAPERRINLHNDYSYQAVANDHVPGETMADDYSSDKPGNRNVFLGILLIVLGLIFLADYYFHWSWASIRKLWPVFLIILGIKFIMDGRREPEVDSGDNTPPLPTDHTTIINDQNENHEK